METVQMPNGRTTTRLGFGCTPLMNGRGRRESLALLDAAYAAGIRHFDTAPMYGFGESESCLGEFLATHPDATVTTKYGIAAPKRRGLLSVARMVVAPVIQRVPAVKAKLARAAAAAAPSAKAKFTAEEARVSLENSLRALRVDRIDIWLLHEAEADDLRDEGLLRFCEEATRAGKIGAFGVGSEAKKLPALRAQRPQFCSVLQYEWSVLDEALNDAVNGGDAFRVHHRALTDNFRALQQKLREDAPLRRQWSEAVGADLADSSVLAALMLKAALVEHPQSIVLVSSKSKAHIEDNVRTAQDAALEDAARRLYRVARETSKFSQAVAA